MMSETGGRQDWAELSDETLTADSTVTPTGDPAPSAIAFFGSNLLGVTRHILCPYGSPMKCMTN